MKKMIKLFLMLMLSTIVNASSSWIPIVMGDITTFVPTVSISPVANSYPVNATVSVNVNGTLSNNKDWIGIFKKGTQKKWGNQIAWSFVDGKSRVALTRNKLPMPAGEYEVALFFNNSLNKVEATASFSVYNSLISNVQNAGPNQLVTMNINKHSSNDDWVGIFKKGVEKKWGNQLAWSFVEGQNSVTINPNNNLPAGEYEIALFFDNSFTEVAFSVEFTVGGDDYGKPGLYINEIKIIHNNNDKYIVYYPEHHVQNAPIVLMLGMSYAEGNYVNGVKTTLRHEGIMKYLASLGCYVIGNKDTTAGWTDATQWPKIPYDKALNEAINKGADKTRFALIGHSAGGMATYRMMKNYRAEGYGGTKNFIIDLHGYHAAGMTRTDLQSLNDTDTLMLMYGGLNGNANESEHTGNPDFSEDPRVLLTLSHLLPSPNKGFIVLDTKDHMYSYGEWVATNMNGNQYAAIKDKNKLLEPIDAMVKYEFFNNNGQYNDARAILFDGYEQTKKDVLNATNQFRNGKEHGDIGYPYRFWCSTWSGIDYCNDHGL